MQVPQSVMTRGSACLAEVAPELVDAVPAAERPLARDLRIATLRLGRGRWQPASTLQGALHGLLVVAGILFWSVSAGGFPTGDLLGPGDLVLPRLPPPELPWEGKPVRSWHVLEPVTLAVLDPRFAALTARWPGIGLQLLEAQGRHAERTMARLSLVHRQRVEERLLLVLWDLAGRYGKVTPDGVLVPIPLRHHQLAALVASLRPSVTLALRRLSDRQIVERRVPGYLLHETFDEAWARLVGGPAPVRVSG